MELNSIEDYQKKILQIIECKFYALFFFSFSRDNDILFVSGEESDDGKDCIVWKETS